MSAYDDLAAAALEHLLDDGRVDESLRTMATALGVSHSLLLYHFGSREDLLAAVHQACDQRQRDHLAALSLTSTEPRRVMRAMWRHLAQESMWPLYRLGFALRSTGGTQTADRQDWLDALLPLVRALDVPPRRVTAEAMLWLATCDGLLWQLVTGADARAVDRAAQAFFRHYDDETGIPR